MARRPRLRRQRSWWRQAGAPRLELLTLWPAAAAIALASLLLWTLVPRLIERAAAQQLGDGLRLLQRVVAPWLAGGASDLQERVTELADGSSLRLTVVADDGTVLADSDRTPAQVAAMDDHSVRPEIAAAMAAGGGWSVRRSATTGLSYAYAARSLTGADGRLYVLRLAQPLDELDLVHRRLAWTMALAGVAALLVAGLVFLRLSRRFFQPLRRLADGAGALAAGDYRHRVEVPDEPHLATLGAALNRLAEGVEMHMVRVRAERDHLEAVVRSMSEGVLVTDREGRARLANPELRRLFGLTGEIAGRKALELTRRGELAEMIEATLADGEERRAVVAGRAGGRRTIALASTPLVAPIEPGGGDGEPGAREIQGVVVVARDTTRETRLDAMRRDFVANVSHELKTPLAAIRAYAETLRDGALADPPAAERFVARTIAQSRRLQALLDDLLTLSRLESLEDRPEQEPVDLLAIVERAAETVEEPARARGLTVVVSAPSPPPPVIGDPESLERLVTNLLDNAVKYNRDGGRVTATLAVEPAPAGPDATGPASEVRGPASEARGPASEARRWLVLEVADTGIGIPEEAVPRIFERFYRVDKGRARAEGGTGLGLAIVKHVAQSAGGTVEVESEVGTGTRFRVRLPLRPPSAAGR